jgi:hypothetical protein
MEGKKVFTAGVLILSVTIAMAQKLKVNGRWNVTSISYIVEPGSDIQSVITSKNDQIELSITENLNKNNWYIQISKSDVDWNDRIEIWIKRSVNGTGNGEVYSGTTFQKINNIPMSFINGKKAVNKIPCQLELRNLSVTIPARDYTTNIVYTLYEN